MVEKRVDKPNGLFNYTLDEQCQFAFGPDHYWCNSYNNDKNAPQCQDMWCSSLNNKQFCKSKAGLETKALPYYERRLFYNVHDLLVNSHMKAQFTTGRNPMPT